MKRFKYNLSHYKLFTCNIGQLIPATCFEVLPGQSIQHVTGLLTRTQPMLAPVFHPFMLRIHHWFVPTRLIWEDWQDHITGGDDGLDSSTHPYKPMTSAVIPNGSLYDYLGVPPGTYTSQPDQRVSALPMRAYNKIYNEWYRDQDLISEVTVDTASGQDTTTPTTIHDVSYGKDYFTAARPWEQKGATVTLSLGDEADVIPDSSTNEIPTFDVGDQTGINLINSTTPYADAHWSATPSTSGNNASWNDPKLIANLSSATGIPINDLREAFAYQKFMENSGRYGSDYGEYLKRWGVNPQDSRLQRPEYLGGGRQSLQISEVLATDGSNTGDMYGHGISALRSNRYRRFFPEHGFVMTLYSVVPKSIYAQGINKMFLRSSKFDYYQPELAMLGDQAIENREVYAFHTSDFDGTFGYQRRYDEYRHIPSTIAAEFRTTSDHWHAARIFSSDPALNQTFIEVDDPDDIFAAPSNHTLYVMANHNIQTRSPVIRRI